MKKYHVCFGEAGNHGEEFIECRHINVSDFGAVQFFGEDSANPELPSRVIVAPYISITEVK